MQHLKGTTVKLYTREKTGVDDFGAPIYDEVAVTVENVLICPASTEDIASDMQLYGKHAVYELHIPKEDANAWEDRTVEFYGKKWRTFGTVLEWMKSLTPGPWNRKIKVERYE